MAFGISKITQTMGRRVKPLCISTIPLQSISIRCFSILHSTTSPSSPYMLLFTKKCTRRAMTTVVDQGDQPHTKVVASAEEALKDLPLHGATIAFGGFGLCGIPETLISALANNAEAQSLTAVALTAGVDGFGMGKLFETPGKIKRMISSYVGENKVKHSF
jgi:hypothetical protein